MTFAAGPADFAEEFSFTGVPCCPGFYLSPPSAAPIQVPELDAAIPGAG
jgi:hypothetical protein